MTKRIRSEVPVYIEVEFDYNPHSSTPVTNIRPVSDWGQEMSTEVEKSFHRHISKEIVNWCTSTRAENGGWSEPYVEGSDDGPPHSVCTLFGGAPISHLMEAWNE